MKTAKRQRKCLECGRRLPNDAHPLRRYCDHLCRHRAKFKRIAADPERAAHYRKTGHAATRRWQAKERAKDEEAWLARGRAASARYSAKLRGKAKTPATSTRRQEVNPDRHRRRSKAPSPPAGVLRDPMWAFADRRRRSGKAASPRRRKA